MLRTTLSLAALVIGTTLAATVPASAAPNADARTLSLNISVADLDLATPEGQRMAHTRINRAADEICRTLFVGSDISEEMLCSQTASADAETSLTHIEMTQAARPTNTQLALAHQ